MKVNLQLDVTTYEVWTTTWRGTHGGALQLDVTLKPRG